MPTPYGSRYSGGGGGSSSGGTISDITSTGGTITVTNPTGPTTNIDLANLVPPGTLLASHQYAPASNTEFTFNTSTLTKLDATNLTLAFTVPANQIVDVDADFFLYSQSGGSIAGETVAIGLLNHTGGAQVGFTQPLNNIDNVSIAGALHYHIRFHLTGLTAGALQLDLAGVTSGTTGGSGVLEAQGLTGQLTDVDGGPALLQAFASV